MTLAAIEVEAVLLGLKVGFLILLYLFIWRIVRSAARDLRLPQESMILSPQQASQLLAQPAARELGSKESANISVACPNESKQMVDGSAPAPNRIVEE